MPNSTRYRNALATRLRLDSAGLALIQCEYCPRVLPWKAMTLDHVIPRSCGGKNHGDNVVFACEECNTGRDRHHQGCETCYSFPGSCLKAMIYRLPAYPPRRSHPCLLSSRHARAIKSSIVRRFSLVNMVRSGRDYLVHDWHGDPWVVVPRLLARKWSDLKEKKPSLTIKYDHPAGGRIAKIEWTSWVLHSLQGRRVK